MAKQFWKPGNMLYPLPAVMISCMEEGQKPNIITAAWVGTINSEPPMVSVSIRPERFSYGIIHKTGEFVINLTTQKLVRETDFCGVRSGRNTDKFAQMNLHLCESSQIKTPGIAESPVNIECVVTKEIPLGSHTMFLAKVVAVGVEDEYIDKNGKFHLNKTGLMAYSHGDYLKLGEKMGSFGYSVRKQSPKIQKKKK